MTAFNLDPPLEPAARPCRSRSLPKEPALSVSFVLPAGITPARSNLPGVIRLGRWTATFVAVPAEGIAWQAPLQRGDRRAARAAPARRGSTSGCPGGAGWQRLPGWLPQERMVWTAGPPGC